MLVARSAGALEEAAAAIRAQGGDVRAVAADVADPHDVERLFAVAEAIDVPTVLVWPASSPECRSRRRQTGSGTARWT